MSADVLIVGGIPFTYAELVETLETYTIDQIQTLYDDALSEPVLTAISGYICDRVRREFSTK